MASATTIFVCTTCQRSEIPRALDEPRCGEKLHAALVDASAYPVEAVSCLNNCLKGCTVAFGAPGKWSYVFGEVQPESHIADVIAIADFHAASQDGQVPWGKRPESLKRKTVARIPPLSGQSQ